MDLLDKKQLASIVRNYPINDVLDALQEVIEEQIDELVDVNLGHSGMVKKMSLIAHHLSLFPRE